MDYMTVVGALAGNDYAVFTDLSWNVPAAQAHGMFMLAGAADAFTIGTGLGVTDSGLRASFLLKF
ncbi:MAG: hypothetical protein Q4G25_10415 [Paracoccus sp. (in: a-proteobacteria)]|nr:hypothetical protein [Paracoccus sp. (in: a-proteobacteria)]